jgi:molecular chaperone HscA
LLESLKAALNLDGEALLTAQEREAMSAKMVELQALVEGQDAEAIRTHTERLGRLSESFASQRMDKSIREALAGVSLDSLDDEVIQ